MSQNIFIDVDGTLLNSNEGVDPRAKEILRQIRLKMNAEYPDSGLYLWSGAGGDYARSKANEHGLAGFFSGFSGKPDVIVDDDPSSAFPERAIIWKGDAQWHNLLQTIFTQSSPSNELIELVGQIIENVQATNGQYQELYRPGLLTYPLPFFGDLENAEIITVGVNPSSTEFGPWRSWLNGFNAAQVAGRLVDYFKISNPKPHPAFAYSEEALNIINCSYAWNAAHIDLSPRATLHANHERDALFFQMLEMDLIWIPRLFALAKNCQQIWFVGGLGANHHNQSVAVFIAQRLQNFWDSIEEKRRVFNSWRTLPFEVFNLHNAH
jgi:hypothetical protein